jgi:hypothetical protein
MQNSLKRYVFLKNKFLKIIEHFHSPFFLFFVLFLTLSQPTVAQVIRVTHQPVPSWIIPFKEPIPSPQTESGELGLRILVYDAQIHVPKKTTYVYLRMRFETQRAVLLSNDFTFDLTHPYQKMRLHQLSILRKGKRLDRLDENNYKSKHVIEDDHLTSSQKTIIYQLALSDLQAGDEVELAYSIEDHPEFSPYFSKEFSQFEGIPTDLWQVRAFYKVNEPFQQLSFNGVKATPKNRKDQLYEQTWHKTHLPGLFTNFSLPSWRRPFQLLQISSFPDWVAFGKWFETKNPHYERHAEFKQFLKEFSIDTNKHETHVMTEILRHVQDNYQLIGGVFTTLGHHVRPLNEIRRTRAATGLEKAYLLLALIHEIGAEGQLGLTHHQNSHRLRNQLPSLEVIDQPVVILDLFDDLIWIDPLLSNQGGVWIYINLPIHGDVLKINGNATEMVQPYNRFSQKYTFLETFHLPDNQNDTTRLKVEIIYKDALADQFRNYYKNVPMEQILQEFDEKYAFYTNSKRVGDKEIKDNREENELRLTLWYDLPKITGLYDHGNKNNFIYFSDEILSNFTFPDLDLNENLVWNNHFELEQKVTLIGKNLKAVGKSQFYEEEDHYIIGLNTTHVKDTLTYHYFISQKGHELPKKFLPTYRSKYNELQNELLWIQVEWRDQPSNSFLYIWLGLFVLLIPIGIWLDPSSRNWLNVQSIDNSTHSATLLHKGFKIWIIIAFLVLLTGFYILANIIYHELNLIDPFDVLTYLFWVCYWCYLIRQLIWSWKRLNNPSLPYYGPFNRTNWVLFGFSVFLFLLFLIEPPYYKPFSNFPNLVRAHVLFFTVLLLCFNLFRIFKPAPITTSQDTEHQEDA